MFEAETELIISASAQRTIGTGASISVKEILAADIPQPIKAFFRTDVDAMLAEELRTNRRTSRFQYTRLDVEHLQLQINSILVLEYVFERSEFLGRLSDAVHMLINYLVRPQWTLVGVIFEKEPTMPSPALLRMMKYFGPYEYLREVLTRYTNDQQITTFTKPEFASILRKIDGEYVKRKTGDELARVVHPMYEFFDFPMKSGSFAMPLLALIRFFGDKGISTLLNRFEQEQVEGTSEITRRKLAEILEGVRRTSGAFEIDYPGQGREREVIEPEPAVRGAHGSVQSLGGGSSRLQPG